MTDTGVAERPYPSLARVPVGHPARRLALAVIAVSTAFFVAALPFAQVLLPPVPAFIASYEAALPIVDVITFILLFTQFRRLRSAALLALASGYLFDAVMTVLYALSFPGLFAPTGLLGAGPQTTAWLYMAWHGGFPICVMAYAALDQSDCIVDTRV